MFRIETEKELLQAFRPRDRGTLEVPKDLSFPLFVRDYLAWSDPSLTRVFLLMSAPGNERTPVGVAFRREPQGGGAVSMCEWCHTTGSTQGVGMITTAVNSKRRVGVHVCLDLGCKERLETESHLSGLHPREVMKPLLERMRRFTRDALRIDTPPED